MHTTSSIFLLPDELEALTGFKLPARQIGWLECRGWIFETDRKGHPKVARTYFNARMTGLNLSGQRIGPRMEFLFQ